MWRVRRAVLQDWALTLRDLTLSLGRTVGPPAAVRDQHYDVGYLPQHRHPNGWSESPLLKHMFCNDVITLRKTCRTIFCVIEKSCILSEAGQLYCVQGSFRHRRIPSQSQMTLASCRLILSPSELNGQEEVRGSPVPYLRGLLSQDGASPHFNTTHLSVLICIAPGLPENLLCAMRCAWNREEGKFSTSTANCI